MTARVHGNPKDVWQSGSYPMNMAVAEPSGHRVHLTGQVAWDAELRVIGVGDAGRQTEAALGNIARVLEPMGGRMADIVSLTTYFVRDEDKDAITAARAAVFRQETAPAGTGVKVSGLWAPELLVELTAIAVIPQDRFTDPSAEGQP